MKYAALSYSSLNIGDDFQTLAAMQFLPRVDTFIDRERLHEYADTEPTALVMNGWFTLRPDLWPPAPAIRPVFVGFHITPLAAKWLEKHSGYFRSHAPIGCRDQGTARILEGWGVPTFLTYCLTLTLPRRERAPQKGVVAVVDASDVEIPRRLAKKAVEFSQLIPPAGVPARLAYARDLLDFYRDKVSLAITTRLHCALPCLAMGIPVVFFGDRKDTRTAIVEELGAHVYPKALYRKALRGLPGRLIDQVDWSPAPVDLGPVPDDLRRAVRAGIEKAEERAS